MKYFAPLLIATPAAAHDGLHLHPHGVDAFWLALSALAVGGYIYAKVKK